MKLLIEEHQYAAKDVSDILREIDALENIDGYVSVNYVGYFYNHTVRDCVFILPKVLLEDVNGEERVFGKYRPEDIIDLDKANPLTDRERDFIYEFAVWIYRAITVFHNDKNTDSSIVYHKTILQVGRGQRRLSNTFLDIILSLIDFNRENQNFFFFILRNLHSGLNKINWTRTIAHSSAIVQDNTPVYIRPVNKRRQINFDEELLIIFFSILNYINERYGFNTPINCNFTLITGSKFKAYLKGLGQVRLRQIKYKYFSDKAIRLWDLCYAFFDQARKVVIETGQKDYLLVKNFNIVFEAIIDELVGESRDKIPNGLKDQPDGKRIDHIYSSQKAEWKNKVRKMFREEIQKMLKEQYDFYAMEARPHVDGIAYIREHFKEIVGKLYSPYDDQHRILSLALEKSDPEHNNQQILDLLGKDFFVVKCELGEDPEPLLPNPSVETILPQNSYEKNVLTALVRRSDSKFGEFAKHSGSVYIMERIPNINLMNIQYLLPMVGGDIDGYYEIENFRFTTYNGNPALRIRIGAYHSIGKRWVQIYRTKMQPGELISLDYVMKMYEN